MVESETNFERRKLVRPHLPTFWALRRELVLPVVNMLTRYIDTGIYELPKKEQVDKGDKNNRPRRSVIVSREDDKQTVVLHNPLSYGTPVSTLIIERSETGEPIDLDATKVTFSEALGNMNQNFALRGRSIDNTYSSFEIVSDALTVYTVYRHVLRADKESIS